MTHNWLVNVKKGLTHVWKDRGWLSVIGVVIGVVIFFAERWLILAGQWLSAQVRLYRLYLASHPVTLIGVIIGLFSLLYLFYGLQWLHYLDRFRRWVGGIIKGHPRLTTLFGGMLILIGLWFINNRGTWVILPFTKGQLDTQSLISEQQEAVQLIAELNQVGVGSPVPVLILWEPREPRTSRGSVLARDDLSLEECDVVLQGPSDFIPLQRISFPRVLAGSQSSRLDLGNLAIGSLSIPSQLVTQSILKILPTGYREFTGQINEYNGELEISVSLRTPPNNWYVAGPSATMPQMMEYLALRIALDLNPELIKASGLDTLSDRDLAFAMGNQAFRQQRYQRAGAFFELAGRFVPLDEKVDAMLGLTYYHLALEQSGNTANRFATALQAMEAAVHEDPNRDGSLLRPYLACLYHKTGQVEKAEQERDTFNQFLRQVEERDFDARVEELKKLPLHGPNRHLSGANDDVLFVDETGTIARATGRPLSVDLLLPDHNPRQITIYGDTSLLFVSPDGAVSIYRQPDEEKVLIEGRALKGVQQIGISASQFGRTNLFLLNLSGRVYWCRLDIGASSSSACPPQPGWHLFPLMQLEVRQVFPVGDHLYLLAADGDVWYTEINVYGKSAFAPRQLTPPAPVLEIFLASDDTLYLLHDNGNIWRYYDDGRSETEDLKLIDPATGTAQIFAAGNSLYLLKRDGTVWRISNPRNPELDRDFTELKVTLPSDSTTIQEIFVTPMVDEDDASGGHTVYLLTDRGVLLQGMDTGQAQITFITIDTRAIPKTAASQ